mgnify:CR=1 FL=1
MPLTQLSAGVVTVVAQTTTYILPPVVVFLQSTVAMELSPDGTTFTLITATTTGVTTGCVAARCTTSTTCAVIVKRYQ